MHPIDPPLVPNPTTPHSVTSLLTQMYRSLKNPRNTFTSSPHLVGCTQRALQESLADNVVFANEGIVHAVFQPSKVDDQTVVGILAEIDHEKSLKAARDAALSVTVAKRMKNKSMVSHRMRLGERADLRHFSLHFLSTSRTTTNEMPR